ncbi:phosphoribosylformylglycinamidine synthase subunit PurQ [Deltaproteobacteria bacterium TL4]
MKSHRTLILSGYGLNCERETSYACEQAGQGQVEIIHTSQLTGGKVQLQDYQFLVFIGGFLDGDDLGAGRVGANRFKYSYVKDHSLQEHLAEFVEAGKPVLGICNGFQVLVKLGVLPALTTTIGTQEISLTSNALGRFEDRWVHLKVNSESPCIFTQGTEQLYLPIRHGEGRIEGDRDTVLKPLLEQGRVPLQYATPDGTPTESYPGNPNGSPWGIASLCNAQGNVMGLMPHPEAFNHYTNHPHWTRLPYLREEGEGLLLFQKAYHHL